MQWFFAYAVGDKNRNAILLTIKEQGMFGEG